VPGFNLRSTDLQAMIGINQLDKIDEMILKRNKNFKYFSSKLIGRIWFPNEIDDSFTSNFAIPIITKTKKIKEQLVNDFKNNEIACRPLISGSMGTQPFYKKQYGELILPNCNIVDECGLYIPNHPKLTKDDIDLMCSILLRNL
jgi:CDP-6-deoxy-D-xylo-4-hexulose-3-dehydrase